MAPSRAATSFCEWTNSRPKVTHCFAINESRRLFAYTGICWLWTGKLKGETGEHQLFAFLAAESNDVLRPIHARNACASHEPLLSFGQGVALFEVRVGQKPAMFFPINWQTSSSSPRGLVHGQVAERIERHDSRRHFDVPAPQNKVEAGGLNRRDANPVDALGDQSVG
jgi:hypothetical protein